MYHYCYRAQTWSYKCIQNRTKTYVVVTLFRAKEIIRVTIQKLSIISMCPLYPKGRGAAPCFWTLHFLRVVRNFANQVILEMMTIKLARTYLGHCPCTAAMQVLQRYLLLCYRFVSLAEDMVTQDTLIRNE